jgi:hypothetical protein
VSEPALDYSRLLARVRARAPEHENVNAALWFRDSVDRLFSLLL